MTSVLVRSAWSRHPPSLTISWRKAMRVLVVESQPHVRVALRFLLSRQSDFQFVGSIGAEPDLAAKLAVIAPDIIILDWALPRHTASHLLSVIRRLPNQPRIIVLSSGL